MRYLRLPSFLFFFMFGSFSVMRSQIPSGWSTVTGQVLDSENRPVSYAKISVFPMDVAISGPLPGTTTDKEGHYQLLSPPFPGRTRLGAVKPEAGYPDTQGSLFLSGNESNESMPELFLISGIHLEANIHLPPPDGLLEASIVDAKTGAPVSTARVLLHRDEPDAMYSTTISPDGHFLFALPPVPIEITVAAPGYHERRYKDAENGSDKLILNNSDHRIIKIELTPEK